MRIAIIGGLGMIGQALTQKATNRGYEVLVLSRSAPKRNEKGAFVEEKQWDGSDALHLSQLIDGVDAVVNLAGASIGTGRWTKTRKTRLLTSRLEPTHALVKALEMTQKKPAAVIQASAIGIYGTGKESYAEDSPTGSDFPARLTTQWEAASNGIDQPDIRRILIRSGVVLHKEKGVLPLLMLPVKLFVGGPLGSGEQVFSWIHIDDEAAAILHLLEHQDCRGIYNLTSPTPLTNRESVSVIAQELKRPNWLTIPSFVLRLLLGEMSTLILDGQNVQPKRLLESGYTFQFPTFERAINNLVAEGMGRVSNEGLV